LLVGFVLWLFDQRARTLLKPPPKARRPKTAAGRHGRLGLAGLFRGRQHARSKGETPLGWQDAPATRIVNGGVVKEALVTKEDRAGQQEQNGFIDATGAAAPALAAVDGHAAAEEGARRSASCLGWLGVREGEEKAAVNNLSKWPHTHGMEVPLAGVRASLNGTGSGVTSSVSHFESLVQTCDSLSGELGCFCPTLS
jgi:hypothetical protein